MQITQTQQRPPLPGQNSLRFASACLLILAGQTLAQGHDAGAPEEVVVTANRIPVPLRQIGTSVSVITAERIEAYGNLSLTDVLRQMPAVQVSRAGAAGQTTSLRIRGEEGFRTLAIMDGIRLSDPAATQVGPVLEHVLSSGINRVEILRGPQGLAYGADAGGVMNISTFTADEGLQGGIDIQAGRFDTRQYSGNLGGRKGQADFFVSASRFDTEAYNTFVPDRIDRDKDGYENDSIHLRAGYNLNQLWRSELVHRRVDGAARFDNCFSATLNGHDCEGRYNFDATRLSLSYHNELYTHAFSWNHTETERENLSSGEFSFGSEGKMERWEYIGSASLSWGRLAFGADHENTRYDILSRDNTGVFAEYLSNFSDRLYLTAGIRHDDNDDFGNNTSHRFSAAWLTDLPEDSTLKFKASLGTGFRAPSPYEISYNSGPWAYAPASETILKQETSEGWEAGMEYLRGDKLRLELVWFDQDVEDAIEFDSSNWSGYLQLDGRSNSRGLELSTEIRLGEQWQLTGNYTYNHTELPDGQQRLRRPRNLFNTGLSWRSREERVDLHAFLRVSRNAVDQSGVERVPLDDFEVLDFSARYHLSDTLQLYARVENVLDKDYQEVFNYYTPGRAAYVGFRMQFSN